MAKKKEEITIRSSTAEYLTYIASVGDVETSFEMRYEDENIWLTQKLMAALYDVDVRTVNYHIKKIFADSELQENSVIRKFRITADDGKTYNTNHYSLEMIIAVGFKVNSERAVQFRKWVNQIAKDYTIKGWVMDVERIKRGTYLTEKYFDEQLERIREIRASERKFYQKVTDLYATAIDYDRTAAATKRFYATVQNKMHFAIHGHTAAELIVERADHRKEHMGLTDSRGRTASATRTVTVLDYSPPSLSQFTAERCNADGTVAQTDGTKVRISAKASGSSVGGKNTLACTVYYTAARAASPGEPGVRGGSLPETEGGGNA